MHSEEKDEKSKSNTFVTPMMADFFRRFSSSGISGNSSERKELTEENLAAIRSKELSLINATIDARKNKPLTDTSPKPKRIYIIDNSWLNKWKAFVGNTGPRPGPISNNDLLEDDMLQPKKNLEKVVHYRGLDETEWNIFYHAYGGGPILIRDSVNIYGEPMIIPTIQEQIKEQLSIASIAVQRQTAKIKNETNARLTMAGEITSAMESLQALVDPQKHWHSEESKIPMALLQNAHGLAFMTEIKAGFILSAKGGSGIVIARSDKTESGWSGPMCFGHGGIAAGLMAGLSQTKTIIVLNTDRAVNVFKAKGQFKFGGDLEVAAGPAGRTAGGDIRYSGGDGFAPCYSYSHSKGLYAGITIDGTVVMVRNEENARFYGKPVTPVDILNCQVQPPDNCDQLHDLYKILAEIDNKTKTDIVSDLTCVEQLFPSSESCQLSSSVPKSSEVESLVGKEVKKNDCIHENKEEKQKSYVGSEENKVYEVEI